MKKKAENSLKNRLEKRLNKSYADKDKGGSGLPAFDWRGLDQEVRFFKPKEGKNRINIVPYIIKTKNHPLVKSGDATIGDPDYLMDIYIHRYVGPGQAEVICPKRNFGKPCPICEERDKYKTAGKEKEANALSSKRTAFYNVVDVKEPDKGIQVFSVSHFLFEKELIEESRASAEDGTMVDFVDVEDGKVITFRAATEDYEGHDFFKYKNFAFVDRDEPLEDRIVDQAISFDSIMKLYTYDEITKLLFGADEEEDAEGDEEEEAPPSKKSAKKKPVKEEEEDNEESDDEDDEVEEAEKEEAADDEDEEEAEEEAEEEEEEEAPPPKKTKAAKKPAAKEKPAAKVTKASSKAEKPSGKKVCPKKHKFGKDCDKFEEDCDDCPLWSECLKAQGN
jgi:flagellar biosynthesis GTPase FlhF